MLKACEDLYQAMHKLLELLRTDYVNISENAEEMVAESTTVNHMFGSQLGIAFVSQSLRQQAIVK